MKKGQAGIIVVAIVAVIAIAIFLLGTSSSPGNVSFGSSGGKGVVIEQIKFKPEVFSGETAVIEVKIKNRGIFDARNLELMLLGLTEEWRIDGEQLRPDSTKRRIFIQTLSGDPRLNGEERLEIWQLIAPNKIAALTYPFTLKLSYDYSSKYEALVRVASQNIRERGKLLDQKISPGPISVSLKSEEFRVTAGFVNVELTISNSGGGEVANRILTLSNLKNIVCPQNTLTFSLRDSDVEKEIKVICRIPLGNVQEFTDVEVSFDLNYRYSIKQDRSIRVRPPA